MSARESSDATHHEPGPSQAHERWLVFVALLGPAIALFHQGSIYAANSWTCGHGFQWSMHIAPVLVEQAAATLRYELYSIPSDEPQIVRAAQLRDSDSALGAIAAIFHQSPLLVGYPDPTASPRPALQQRSAQ